VVKKCLAKDPDERWQSVHDVAEELKWIAGGGSQAGVPAPVVARRRSRERLGWIVAAVATIAALAVGVLHFREAPTRQPVVRFSVPLPEGGTFPYLDLPVVSPDGERVVFSGQTADGNSRLWLRPLNSLATQPLAGTEGAFFPFWSPDSRSIAFFASGKVKKIDLAGGGPQTLCDSGDVNGHGTWNRDGVIVFARSSGGPLYQVPSGGGQPQPVTALDESRQEVGHTWPHFLPDGRRFLYLARSAKQENNGIYVGSLEGKPRLLLAANSNASYAPPGYLLFGRGQTLTAQPFDANRLRFTGDPFPVAEQVQLSGGNMPGVLFSVSGNGVLCYRRAARTNTQLAWFDRAGKRLGSVGEPGAHTNPALSPDEKKVAVGRFDPQTNMRDIWVLELARGTALRLTFDPADDLNPVWSPDGTRIAFSSDRKGHRDIYQKLSSGAGSDELVLESASNKAIEDWSRDGRFMIFNAPGPGPESAVDVWALPAPLKKQEAPRKAVPILQGPGTQDQAQLSPDSRWIAYRSTESGGSEVYVQTFPPSGGKWQISTAGGVEPRWRGDGKELFYLAGNKLMAVEVKAGPASFEAGIPKALFEAPVTSEMRRNRYVVTADGQRFLMLTPVGEQSTPLIVVLNWTAGLKR
jgi:Tol biopolymer transport system component